MSMTRRIAQHPLRFISSLFVLAGAVTAMSACNSGEAALEDPAERARLALGWPGGCVCLPELTQCPTGSGSCIRAPSLLECASTICRTGRACYVLPDGKSCSGSDTKIATCDGGYCGICPGCYLKSGICNPGTSVSSCKVEGDAYCQSCDDGNECTADSCTARGCASSAVADKTACTGGLCFGGKCCTGCSGSSGCQSGVTVEACGAAGSECRVCAKPSNPCLRPTCVAGACGTEPVPVGTSCSDGDVCNGEESCDGAGTCVKGTAKDCTTSDPCQIGRCDAKLGCILSPNAGAKCSDGDACTLDDLCDAAGKCVPGTRKACGDGRVCTKDECDPASGNCINSPLPNDTQCDDGAACTQGETCQDGICTAGAVSCDDKVYCTKDTVVCPAGTCSFDPLPMQGQPCVPTNKCFYNGTCDATGNCGGGTPVNCDDGNPCTKDSCDPTQGCLHENEPATTVCVDGNPCTTDDRCRPLTGKCAGTPIVCAALDDCHAPGTCDATTGRCDDPRREDGFPCANRTGSCAAGLCKINETGGAAGMAGAAGAVNSAGTAGSIGTAGSAGSGFAGASASLGGAAGDTNGVGGDVAAGGTTGGKGSGRGGSANEGDIYERNPGGCACSLPSRTPQSGLALITLMGVAWSRLRRGRRSR